ncbi:MAG: hypothetical protein N2450_07215 [bacterium]|nr:hypothetical protein [bacterium]
MKWFKTILIFAIFTITYNHVSAQPADTLRVLVYNILNYPNSQGSQRNPYFRKIFRYVKPDVILLGEMISQVGIDSMLTRNLNIAGTTDWSAAPFIDGPDTDGALLYRTTKVQFLGQDTIGTELRNINVYRIKPLNGDSTTITTFLLMHLKASTGNSNVQQRGREASRARQYANNLPPNSKFVYCGDLNLYTSTEVAYNVLTSDGTNINGKAYDPLTAGTWTDNAAFASIHTQSTRTTQLSDGGATGGLDDRFDFILPSMAFLDTTSAKLLNNTYVALGNDGNHFNQAINQLPNLAVPDSIAEALYFASDHLPLYGDLIYYRPIQLRPSTPLNLTAHREENAIRLRWNRVNTDTLGNPILIQGYKIYSSNTGYGNWTLHQTINSPLDTTYLDTSIQQQINRYYHVKAFRNP